MKARLEIPSRAFIIAIAFYETHVFPRFVPEIFARFTYFAIPYSPYVSRVFAFAPCVFAPSGRDLRLQSDGTLHRVLLPAHL